MIDGEIFAAISHPDRRVRGATIAVVLAVAVLQVFPVLTSAFRLTVVQQILDLAVVLSLVEQPQIHPLVQPLVQSLFG